MKHIGIVGVSAEGASLCYKLIVSESAKILGPNKHPEITLNNPPFVHILEAQNYGNWEKLSDILLESVTKLGKAGADFAIIPANSVHFVFESLNKKSPMPLISLVDVTVEKCVKSKYKKVLVLGVGITMSKGLYNDKLLAKGIKPIIPTEPEQESINKIIYNELVKGNFNSESVSKIVKIIGKYKSHGADTVILGCTELPLVINDSNCPLPFIDTTRTLAEVAVVYALD